MLLPLLIQLLDHWPAPGSVDGILS
jgi:hypothetical protein